jgi:hypothetical protein
MGRGARVVHAALEPPATRCRGVSLAHGHEAHTRRKHNKKAVHISPADRLLHHRPLLSDVLAGQHLLLLMQLCAGTSNPKPV